MALCRRHDSDHYSFFLSDVATAATQRQEPLADEDDDDSPIRTQAYPLFDEVPEDPFTLEQFPESIPPQEGFLPDTIQPSTTTAESDDEDLPSRDVSLIHLLPLAHESTKYLGFWLVKFKPGTDPLSLIECCWDDEDKPHLSLELYLERIGAQTSHARKTDPSASQYHIRNIPHDINIPDYGGSIWRTRSVQGEPMYVFTPFRPDVKEDVILEATQFYCYQDLMLADNTPATVKDPA